MTCKTFFLLVTVVTTCVFMFGFAWNASADDGKKEAKKDDMKNPRVLIKTSIGDITVELFPDKAPIGVKNFLRYVDEKFYEGTIFHRVMNGFMIQGGGFDKNLVQKKPHKPIKNEAFNGLKNDRGTLAYARTNIVDSATCQFFINVVDNASLNHTAKTDRDFGYCVFAKVIDGMDVVDTIKQVPTGSKNGMRNVPLTPVVIVSVERI